MTMYVFLASSQGMSIPNAPSGPIVKFQSLQTWEKKPGLMSPPWDFAPWLYLVSKLLAKWCPSQMHHLSQLSSLRLLRKSLASIMSLPWYLAPWLHLVSKLLGNWCPSQMLTPGQILSSYILKPLRKDPASIMNFIPSLLIFGGQNLNECVQMLMPNLCITSKRWQDDEWRPEARQPPNIYFRN